MGRWRNYVFIAFSVLAMGVAARWNATSRESSSAKTVDEYWAETGLGPEALEDVVDDDSCRSSQRYFLACVNAVGSVADRLGLRFTTDGRLLRGTAGGDSTERDLIEPWKEFYANNQDRLHKISFRKTWRKMIKDHVAQDRRAAMTGAALNGFLSVFRDPHTYVIPVKFYQEVVAKSHISSSALGIVLARGEGGYFLRKVVEGSISSKAGLKKGDWILSVDGIPLRNVPSQRLSDVLRARVGATTRLEVVREGRSFIVEVPRTNSEIPSVSWRRLEGTRPVALLTINKFARESCQDVKGALAEINVERLRGLVLDVRDNTGGQMDEAACIVSLFVGTDKPAFKIRYLDPAKESETYYGQEEKIWTGKIAVLINSGTASAAEILAGSLHDHGRALLVGERSFGKGSFQEGEIWNRNRGIAFFQTKGFYYLPSGFSPQLRGLEPDVKADFRQAKVNREEDQYVNPLNPPIVGQKGQALRSVDLSTCLEAGDMDGEDPQMTKARTALFCAPVANGGTRGSL